VRRSRSSGSRQMRASTLHRYRSIRCHNVV
jgi:hypothetical protein